ncbi:type II toxin-antitoxin system RelE/ParE family toxin [Botrimarina sp.]|uniref:type II toxin-antitoxin system RelE/ParE family toxin n=1 Tax=Botrimarina sp. TaxID=2795802 RepID=UPI0032ECA88F
MPQTLLQFYQDDDGSVPVRDWLAGLQQTDRRAFAKCVAAIDRLAALGHELRRPHADLLRDGIYELRVRHQRVNYRVLYFFHGQNVAFLAHGLVKEKRVPNADIERALARKQKLQNNPAKHTYRGGDGDGED